MGTVTSDDFVKPEPVRAERLTSIDALRGFDMFWISGGDSLAEALAKWWNTPESKRFALQFEHVAWEGFRFYDLIFPLFLFTVGVVLPFSLRKYQSGDQPKAAVFGRIARRVVLLFLLGLVYNNFLQFRFENQRYAGVLQRIAICYGIAAVIFLLTKVRTQAILFVAILLGYWAILAFVPAPESKKAGDYTIETNLSGYLDRQFLPGKINKGYYGYGDNEGLLSTIPAIATALLGVLAGNWLLVDRSGWIKSARPGRWRTGLPGLGHSVGAGISDHQDPLDQLVCSRGRRMEPIAPGILLHRDRCNEIPAPGRSFSWSSALTQSPSMLPGTSFPLTRSLSAFRGRRPDVRIVWAGDRAIGRCGSRVASAAPPLSQQDLPAGVIDAAARRARTRKSLARLSSSPGIFAGRFQADEQSFRILIVELLEHFGRQGTHHRSSSSLGGDGLRPGRSIRRRSRGTGNRFDRPLGWAPCRYRT